MTRLFRLLLGIRNRHYLLFDVVVILLVPAFALALRLDTAVVLQAYIPDLLAYICLSMLIKLLVFYRFGMYRHLWRYASIEEVGVILISILSAGFVFSIVYLLVLPVFPDIPQKIPRSVPAIDVMLSLMLHGGIRLIGRMYSTEQRKRQRNGGHGDRRVLIIGAGNSGTMIAREMIRHPDGDLTPIGYIDDDPRKAGGVIHGIPVFGSRRLIPDIVREYHVSQVLIAMPSVSGRVIQSFLKIIEPLRVSTRILPSVSELVGDTVEMRHFRSVRIDDLLRREPVKTDMREVRSMLKGKRVLLTGAGGSIGGELARLIAQCDPDEMWLLGHGENSIHSIERELQEKYPHVSIHSVIADIRDRKRLCEVFRRAKPEIVYHAAAHKHVPLMESNAIDAVSNNVLGTLAVMSCAREVGSEQLTLISTDKAVSPTSVMGATKRLAEIAVQLCAREHGVNYAVVRFGNVLGSRGSVVPIFMEQIEAGGPITITHPEMKRYFMTIPEAVQLVLQASALRGKGDVYVLDMGEPVRIVDLAEDLIRFSGREPYKDIKIQFSGLRAGEKLNEALFREGEVFKRSRHEKIFTVLDPTFALSSSLISGNGSERILSSLAEFETWVRYKLLTLDDRDALLEEMRLIIPEIEELPQAIADPKE